MLDLTAGLILAWVFEQSPVGRRTSHGPRYTIAGRTAAFVDFALAPLHREGTHLHPRLCTSRRAFRFAEKVGTVADKRLGMAVE